MTFFYLLLLAFAVSLDGFFAGIAYGIDNINLPSSSVFMIGLITFCFSAAAISFAQLLSPFLLSFAALCGTLLLIVLGISSIYFQYRRTSDSYQPSAASPLNEMILTIIKRPEQADLDNSQQVSSFEAILLGLALGIDSLTAVFGAALNTPLPTNTPLLLCLVQMIFIWSGLIISNWLHRSDYQTKILYLPGFIFLLLGLIRF